MEPILVEEYYCGEVKMHMQAWAIFPKDEVDLAAKSVIFSARIVHSGKKLVEALASTSCDVADFISEDVARRVVKDLLFSATSSSRYARDWRTVLPYMEGGLFHFSNGAAGIVADYYKATGSECIGIHVLVDMCRCFVIKEIEDDDEKFEVESVGDNFELESVDY